MGELKYDLRKDNECFKAVLPNLLKESKGKFVIIHDCKVQGTYESREEALNASKGRFNLGEFLVKEIIEDDGTPRFFSYRVAFA